MDHVAFQPNSWASPWVTRGPYPTHKPPTLLFCHYFYSHFHPHTSYNSTGCAIYSTFTCCGRKINKLEIAIFALAFTFPLLFDWIPLTTNSYGPSQSGDFCWFRMQNCSTPSCTAELWEKIWLSTVPFGLVAFLILLLFTVSLCLLGYKMKKAKADRRALIEVGVTNSIFFIVFLIITIALLPNKITVNIHIGSGTLNFIVITVPLIVMLVPLTLLMAVHLPFSSMILRICLKCRQHSRTPGCSFSHAKLRSENLFTSWHSYGLYTMHNYYITSIIQELTMLI